MRNVHCMLLHALYAVALPSGRPRKSPRFWRGRGTYTVQSVAWLFIALVAFVTIIAIVVVPVTVLEAAFLRGYREDLKRCATFDRLA